MTPPPARASRHRAGAALLVALSALLLAAAPVAADDPSFGPHSGNYGVHALIDTFEFPTRCDYDGTTHHITKIHIRAPIVYAFDRTNHEDREAVGFRYHIEYNDAPAAATTAYTNWPDYFVSAVHRQTATDQHSAAFSGKTFTFGGDPTGHDRYRVSIQMIWYFPGATHKDGQAVHVYADYLQKDPAYDLVGYIGSCPSTSVSPP